MVWEAMTVSLINHHNKHAPYHKQVTVPCFGHSGDNLLGIGSMGQVSLCISSVSLRRSFDRQT